MVGGTRQQSIGAGDIRQFISLPNIRKQNDCPMAANAIRPDCPSRSTWGAWEDEIVFNEADPNNWCANYLREAYRYIIKNNQAPPEPTNLRTPQPPTEYEGDGPPPPSTTPPTDSAEGRGPPAASVASASATTEQIPIWGDAVPDVPPAWGPKMAFGYTYKRGRGEHYCVLCAKFADENHCNGAQRQKRIKGPSGGSTNTSAKAFHSFQACRPLLVIDVLVHQIQGR